MSRLLSLVLLCIAAASVQAMQVREVTFISPVTGKKFVAIAAPLSQSSTHSEGVLADMGSDDDGCRHSSNLNEYELYVITDPTSYFSALAIEWEEVSGRFVQPLTPEIKDWVLRRFNADFKSDWGAAFSRAKQIAAGQGLPPPDRETFIMPQESIPLDRRFTLALECYQERGARPAVVGKIALTGSWALRNRFQIPIADPRLAGGFEEVNNSVSRELKDGETFDLAKWNVVYREIFDHERLTPSGYFVAGQVLYGFEQRLGNAAAAEAVLDKLQERFRAEDDSKNAYEFQRGLVRSMRRVGQTYRQFLNVAATGLRQAIANEEFTRSRLPEHMLAIAESLRRSGNAAQALDWYVALAQMAETQPKMRADIRVEGRVPNGSAPYLVQIGWIADRNCATLLGGQPMPDKPTGQDAALLNAILFEGLGTLEYNNPGWAPATGATDTDSAVVLDQIGKGLLMYKDRFGEWPESLGELWARDIIHDRNRLNRFRCPVTGAAYRWQVPGASDVAPRTILITVDQPVTTKDGPRWPTYLANNTVVWAEAQPKLGDLWLK